MLVTFATNTSQGHERNNTGEKTFACKICDKIGTFKYVHVSFLDILQVNQTYFCIFSIKYLNN